jgi:hypothetical protein
MTVHSTETTGKPWWMMSRFRVSVGLTLLLLVLICNMKFINVGAMIDHTVTSTQEEYVAADDADDLLDTQLPETVLDWLVGVLQREPFHRENGEVKSHFSPLSTRADHIVDFKAMLARITGKLVIRNSQADGNRKIHAVLVEDSDSDASDVAVLVRLKVGPSWFPYVVNLSFHEYSTEPNEEVAGGWGVAWSLLWF